MNKIALRQRSGRRPHAVWPWLVAAGLLLAGFGYFEVATSRFRGGAPAPGFVLEASSGGHVDLGRYLGRQPVVLLFYMSYQ